MIGDHISTARKLRNITQDQLAELSKVNLRTIQRIENNENVPRGNTLKLICDALEIDVPLNERLNQEARRTLSFYADKILGLFFLALINLILMTVFGYLLLDGVWFNIHTICGTLLLSFFLPAFIVSKTPDMSGIERTMKFGSGFIFYMIIMIQGSGFPTAFKSGLIPCLCLCLMVFYYGNLIYRPKE